MRKVYDVNLYFLNITENTKFFMPTFEVKIVSKFTNQFIFNSQMVKYFVKKQIQINELRWPYRSDKAVPPTSEKD